MIPLNKGKGEKAFTLIELLVVIAVIALFGAAVLVSLSGAKNRAKDVMIGQDMDQLRKGAEVYRGYQGGSFTGLNCSVTNPNISDICSDIDNQNGANGGPPAFNVSTENYCAYVIMATSSTKWYCVNSQGKAKETTTNPATSACTGASYECP